MKASGFILSICVAVIASRARADSVGLVRQLTKSTDGAKTLGNCVSSAVGDTSNNCEFCFARTGLLDDKKSVAPGCFVLAERFVQGEDKERLFKESDFFQKAAFSGGANFADHKYFCRDSCKAAGTATPTAVTDMQKTLEEQKAELDESRKNVDEANKGTLQGKKDEADGTALAKGIKENADKLLAALVAKIGASKEIADAYETQFNQAVSNVETVEGLLGSLTATQASIDETITEIERMRERLGKLKEKLPVLEVAIEDAVEKLNAAKDMTTKVTSAQDALEGKQKEKDELVDSLTDLDEELAASKSRNGEAQEDADAAQEAKEAAKVDLDESNVNRKAAEDGNAASLEANEKATGDRDDAIAAKNQKDDILRDLIGQVADALATLEAEKAALLQELQDQILEIAASNAKFEALIKEMEVASKSVEERKRIMQETDMWHVFGITPEPCEQENLPEGSNLCANTDYAMNVDKLEDWKTFMQDNKNGNYRKVKSNPIWKTAFKTLEVDRHIWEKLSEFAKQEVETDCWYANGDPSQTRKCAPADDLFYRAKVPDSDQEKHFIVADECWSPGKKSADFKDKLKYTGEKGSDPTKTSADGSRNMFAQAVEVKDRGDNKVEQTQKMGEMEGTCYDKKIFEDETSEREYIMEGIREAHPGLLNSNSRRLRFRGASPSSPDPSSGSAQDNLTPAQAKGIAVEICTSADALAKLINDADTRELALQGYLAAVGGLIQRVATLKDEVTGAAEELDTKFKEFEVEQELVADELKAVDEDLLVLFGKLKEIQGEIAKEKEGAPQDTLEDLLRKREELESSITGLDGDKKDKDEEIKALDDGTEDLKQKAATDNNEAEESNGETADNLHATDDLEEETQLTDGETEVVRKETEENTIALEKIEDAIEEQNEKKRLEDAGAKAEKSDFQNQIEGKKQELKQQIENLDDFREEYKNANTDYKVYDEIFKYCDSLSCYRSCRTGGVGPDGEESGVLPNCKGQEAFTKILGPTIPTSEPTVVAQWIDFDLGFISNAFGCLGAQQNAAGEDEDNYMIDGIEIEATQICEGLTCIRPDSQEEVEKQLKALALKYSDVRKESGQFNVRLVGQYESNDIYRENSGMTLEQFEQHQKDGRWMKAGMTWDQLEQTNKFGKEDLQKKKAAIKCRAETIKTILVRMMKDSSSTDEADDTWICTEVNEKIGDSAKVSALLSVVEDGVCNDEK